MHRGGTETIKLTSGNTLLIEPIDGTACHAVLIDDHDEYINDWYTTVSDILEKFGLNTGMPEGKPLVSA